MFEFIQHCSLALHCVQVYDFAKAKYGKFGEGDLNSTLLYNSSTMYDDLAWAAGKD